MAEMRAGPRCDLCGGTQAVDVLESTRLEGPLVKCLACGLYYVDRGDKQVRTSAATQERASELVDRALELDIVRPEVEEAEGPWRTQASGDRLARVLRHVQAGRLLDVGCATGSFLTAAGRSFDAEGVEPDPYTSGLAREAGLRVHTGTIADITRPSNPFDVITMFHVIEHLESPRESLGHVRSLIREGGFLVVETPTVDTLWFRVARRKWRQLLPDHYFFFSRTTLTRLLDECGFTAVEHEKVGRRVSLRFAADRARRAGLPLADHLGTALRRLGLEDTTVYLRPGDIMTMTAIAR